ncbi:MAG: tRNA pseudouridine(38-40) synthase TruA [Defluviitaleaceae bacterium]|nr:tRNA pseudouridine(38-40) synthase TruA [Defluviitaleaceae bacterium]MCL2273515.1 tRNA pseudouridine(38-40) synthase TruA [Defluviitaleaceae bacterium]
MRVLLTIAYDGTAYAGWQRQENALAVQQVVEEALASLIGCAVTLTAASRTDAGVHALGQRAAFNVEGLRIPLNKLPRVLNGLLPADISVSHAQAVPQDFNPRFAARFKTYRYQIWNASVPNPMYNRYSAFINQPLDILAMQKAARHFIGRHDFAAFCATGGSAKTTVREIYTCTISQAENLITLEITGNAFLYNMVRIIAGTLTYAGLGKINPCIIPDIIAARDRTQAGKTMPPQGLTLVEVQFKE